MLKAESFKRVQFVIVVMNEFGRTQLEKYGWKTGSGLGKQEDGIKNAIKPSLKFDKCGVGHNQSEQFTFHWWDHAFNKAAKNIEVINTEDKVEVRKKENDKFEISTKKSQILNNLKDKLTYGSFVKTGTLTGDGKMISCENSNEAVSSTEEISSLHTDEEIFKKCSGRTAHRAARHGLKMNGKLMRIMKQEKEALCKKVSDSFHKRVAEHEKQDKSIGIKQPLKKNKVKEEASEHRKHSSVSSMKHHSVNFISSTVDQCSDMASKIKKKKSSHT